MSLYRPYIDGLRAIAVLAVILFHFHVEILSGGFLGVDIFFVISGFLITQLLLEASDRPWKVRVGQFYVRRARRILPALLFTSIVVAAVALVVYLPVDLMRLGKYLFFTPLMLANLASAQEGGYFYFSIGGPFTSLTHFWSLAVEEQFYIFYPLLLVWATGRHKPRRHTGLILTLLFASLAICGYGALKHPQFTFYFTPARTWELMCGALAAVAPLRAISVPAIKEGVALACLGVIVVSLFLFNSDTGFPYPYVLLPCGATALLLYVARQNPPAALGLLSVRPLVFTGKISYSLYLWHAPVLAFVQYYAIRQLTAAELAATGVAVYAISSLSWLAVENPIRYRVVLASNRAFIFTALAVGTIVGGAGAYFWWGDGLPWRFRQDIQTLARVDPPPDSAGACMTIPLSRIATGELCRIGPSHPGVKTALLWGDSHAYVLLPAYESLAKSRDVQIEFAGKSSCRPVLGTDRYAADSKREDCDAFNRAMLLAAQRIHPDIIILNALWDPEALRKEGPAPTPGVDIRRQWDVFLKPLRDTGSEVCVVLDVPFLPYLPPYALVMARRRGIDPSFVYAKRAEVMARYSRFESEVRTLEAAGALRVADPKNLLCPDARCELEVDGRSLYRDRNHLSVVGAMAIRPSLASCLP